MVLHLIRQYSRIETLSDNDLSENFLSNNNRTTIIFPLKLNIIIQGSVPLSCYNGHSVLPIMVNSI